MKLRYFYFVLFIFLLASVNGCKNDSSNPVNEINFSGQGADYQPLVAGRAFSAKITGTLSDYDSLGNLMEYSQMTNQSYTGNFGVFSNVRNLNVLSVYANENGRNELICYLNSNNGSITGFGKNPINPIGLILPSNLEVGQEWVVNPASPPSKQFKIKFIEALNSFANSAGNTFQNTINLHFIFSDSTVDNSNYYNQYYTRKVDANVYLAKEVGVVGVKVNNYQEVVSLHYYGLYTYDYYIKRIVNGEISLSY